ncbi:MAG: phosphate ABC transporter ATP-binding protein, partial [Chloroflexi bacterium]|nr:phosphate ABC transporter ATP-binding protein [Chloroflexota bacterium]
MVKAQVRIQDVTYRYGSRVALRNITIDIPANQITVFFGPASSGKTTLLRLINRLN